ncbi:Lrp/AsnC ligand binding domain-containing protein [Candidatus Hecatella orcuttiae]|uniref:Lrp/AsnC ligand binding domain-containing protein n=1 Tax=Candidatus Hecatella orcuttiae TaxID=1935119 RepID=UPI002867CADF|nr:Lrp/AsnC ligand binding domain-containing protein [Candidatus Hecatella orcuttiae]
MKSKTLLSSYFGKRKRKGYRRLPTDNKWRIMMLLELDNIDINILKILQKNSRISLKAISKLVKTSVPTVRTRIEKMFELGIIKRFTIAIDSQKLPRGTEAFISLQVKLPEVKEVVEVLSKMDEVTAIYHTSGEYNLIIRVWLQDIRSLPDFIICKLSTIETIRSFQCSILVESFKEHYGPVLKHELGLKLLCFYCRKDITDDLVTKTINGAEQYFCCETCASAIR